MEYLSKSNGLLDEILLGSDKSIVWYSTLNINIPGFRDGLALKSITLLRPVDIIILPESNDTIAAWEWAKKIFNYTDNQVRWHKFIENNEDLRDQHLRLFKEFKDTNVIIVGFYNSRALVEVAKELNISLYGDFIEEIPDKRWIHPTIPNSIHTSNLLNQDLPKINSPTGYSCYDKDELRKAKQLLQNQGITSVVIKYAKAAAGNYIFFCNNDDEFEEILSIIEFKNYELDTLFMKTPPAYVIEKKIELTFEYEKDEIISTPVVYFMGSKQIQICRQLVSKNSYQGSKTKPFDKKIMENLQKEIDLLAEKIPKFNKGPWGVDFMNDKEGNVYVVDPNLGRFNSGTYPCIFISLYAPGKCYMNHKINFLDWNKLFETLNLKGLSFNFEKKKGIMYMVPYSSNAFSNVIFVGDTDEEVEYLYEEYCLIKEELLKIS